MATGMITDVLGLAARQAWMVSYALCIIIAVYTVLQGLFSTYTTAIAKAQADSNREAWTVKIHMSMATLLIMTITVIGCMAIVIPDKWAEGVTSALLMGVGFGMRDPVVDVVWGFIRRVDHNFMKVGAIIRVPGGRQGAAQQGIVSGMSLMKVTLQSMGTGTPTRHNVAWGECRNYEVVG